MGSYGIGPARIVAAAIEQGADEQGIVWPRSLAPWQVHLVALGKPGEETLEAADRLYEELREAGLEVLYDDRDAGPGEKLTDAELLGCPLRIVVGKRAPRRGRGRGAGAALAAPSTASRSPTRRGAPARSSTRLELSRSLRPRSQAPPVRHRPLRPAPERRPAAARRCTRGRSRTWSATCAWRRSRSSSCSPSTPATAARRRRRCSTWRSPPATTSTASSPGRPASTRAWARCSTRWSTGSRSSPARSSAGTSSCCRAGRSRCSRCASWRPWSSPSSALRRGVDLEVNWLGRIGVFLVFGGIFWAMVFDWWVIEARLRRRRGDRGAGDGPLRARGARPRRRMGDVQPSSST